MSSETIFVDCPGCGCRMEVERATGKVIKHWAKMEKKEGVDPFAESLKKMKEEKDRLDKYFSQAPSSLQKHKQELLDQFEQEKKKVNEGGPVERPINPLDLD
jgi:uncharacterized protein YecE (DUF72 family)